ncbi:MAG: sulfatase-like hydrolase/transferase, partial [Rikenellaceae bacterium]
DGEVVGLEKSDPISVNYEENYGDQPTGLKNPELLKMQWAHGHNGTIVNGIPRIGYMKGGESAKWVDEDMADYFVGKIKHFLDDNKENPFFLYYGLHQPHVPRTPNGRFAGKTTMGPRGDAIIEADWCVGELLSMLEERGLLENTLIIFSSDNGPVLNDGYKDGAWELLGDHKPAGGLRGGKYSLFDAGTHVPFFTYWKGKIEPHKTSAMVSQLDLLASIAELIGEEIPEGLDTQNHLDTFMGKSDKGRDSYIVEAMGRLAYRKGDYAMIPPFKGSERNETGNELGNSSQFALYNLTQDPAQMNEISTQQSELMEQLKGEFMSVADGYYDPNTAEETLK